MRKKSHMVGHKKSAVYDNAQIKADMRPLDDILQALKRLDGLVEKGIAAAHAAYGAEVASDPYRGLYISQKETERLLAREPGAPTLYSEEKDSFEPVPGQTSDVSRLVWLRKSFALSSFDIDLVLIALAPELDLRYERLYAYLQDDVTRKRPTVDLALNLLSSSGEEKLARRAHFSSDASLIQQGLLHLIPDPNHTQPPLLSHYLKLDGQIVRFLLGQDGLDPRLAAFCEITEPEVSFKDLTLKDEIKKALPVLVIQAWKGREPLRLYFQGPQGLGKRRTAEAIAGEMGRQMLVADLVRIADSKTEFRHALKILFREAWFQDAILYIDGVDSLPSHDQANRHRELMDALATDAGMTILAGEKPLIRSGRKPTGVIIVQFPIPDFTERRQCWHANLKEAEITLNRQKLDVLAGRFQLTPGQIANAAMIARNTACWRASKESSIHSSASINGKPTLDDLFTAARLQTGHDLATLAQRIEPTYTWDDIVLPEDTMTQLREICQWVSHRYRVLGEWGFNKKLSMGKGVNALFVGPTGTGKTMAAEIIANELGLDLYKIDLAGVVSKYIGETEKNLDRIFYAAKNANAILFFDEADALFGKRSEVRDSHDRYANIEISYLLQKMEEYEGIAILASNLRQNLDESFVRRMAFTVHFPFPDDASRLRIWAGIWPSEIPLAYDMDFGFLAHQFKLSGGNIKNIALAAAFLAADGGSVKMAHLLQATRREYQKMGKNLTEAELHGNQIDSKQMMGNLQ